MILSKKYNEEINKIVMNDDMKKRILQNVLAANENYNSAEENIKVKTTIPKVKKYNNFKRNMQMVAACFTVVLCLSVAKTFWSILFFISSFITIVFISSLYFLLKIILLL